jgi:ATP-dependent 26S proteasome regulatory subunit
MTLDVDVNLEHIAHEAKHASGADLKAICTEAGMFAIRDEQYSVSREHFEQAMDKVLNKNKNQESTDGVMFG